MPTRQGREYIPEELKKEVKKTQLINNGQRIVDEMAENGRMNDKRFKQAAKLAAAAKLQTTKKLEVLPKVHQGKNKQNMDHYRLCLNSIYPFF